MARIPQEIIEEIQRRVDVLSLVGEYTSLRRTGNSYMGLCPFHADSDPSFSVDPEKGLFYCFGCHKGGNIFQFVMEVEHCTFYEAVERLAERAGVSITAKVTPEEEASFKKERALQDLNLRLVGLFEHFLHSREEGRAAREYCVSRGIDLSWARDTFHLGYAPHDPCWLYRFLRRKGYSEELLHVSGLFSAKREGYAIFSHRLIFPIYDVSGKVVGFGGRALREDQQPKYLNSPETSLFKKKRLLYGLHRALPELKKTKKVILVEGYIDVLLLHQHGIMNVVAPLGTAFSREQAIQLKRYADSIIFFFDGDTAGERAAQRAGMICEAVDFSCRMVVPPRGEDPASFLQKKGVEEVRQILMEEKDVFQCLLERRVKEGILTSSETDMREFVTSMFSYIRSVQSTMRRERLLEEMAESMGVSLGAIKEDFDRFQSSEGNSAPLSTTMGRNRRRTTEVFLFQALCAHPEYYTVVRPLIQEDALEDASAKELFFALEECLRAGTMDRPDAVLEHVTDEKARELALEAVFSGEFEVPLEAVREAVFRWREQWLHRRRREIERKIALYEREGGDIQELLLEKMYLDKELEKLRGYERYGKTSE
ncbi:DNA primase [Spirochaeta thermophila]|uniref:DNA primase n=1 Tax=Winmispira thermophila (strain ATCC 49972 / DSM 6192 / RI 19.B1) TaxID=665571 RepID=E0RSN9_WINT6|nr:DNA primase [Spirochaeta thermophila]ADN02026.1 DNA primase [Spirochaeta thermophila DSM 6192]